MNDLNSTAARIDPVLTGETRPLWSVMIPTFNCAIYLRQTLQSVLLQAPDPAQMQIEVVDDVSTQDDPEAEVREVGAGRVLFHRKPQNEGGTCNFNTCIQRARGELVHILHGDDYVLPGFYAAVAETFKQHPDAAMVVTRSLIVDEQGALDTISGRLSSWEKASSRSVGLLAYQNDIRTPAVVVRRSFYEKHGGFVPALIHTADWEMWLRACHFGSALAINEPLASYRMFAANHTGRLMRTGENLRDYLRLADLASDYLGDELEMRRFRRMVSDLAWGQAGLFLKNGDASASDTNLKLWREVTPALRRVYIRARDRMSGRL